ncbi:MAG TPA: molybdopterin cofactor-binding domain-containing protein, partial [Kofleriaceae bacterium]|nr:molybdopterin cofactor-binding domain-containing protein [Kofleriaceae bacterium]
SPHRSRSTRGAGASLVVACHLPAPAPRVLRERCGDRPAEAFAPNAFVRIDGDGTVTITLTKTEIGQGVRTALPMIVAEELGAAWSSIRVAHASPGAVFPSVGTGGSWSVGGTWLPLRKAGATAREMLITAAAARWSVARAECRAEDGAIVHAASGRRLSFGELVAAASRLPVPVDATLKEAGQLTLIGQRIPRLDGPAIVTGGARFGIDARVPGMRFAVVVRPPALGGSVAGFDPSAARRIPGVRSVVQVPSGVAVIAESTWAALRAREALRVTWSDGPAAAFDSARFRGELAAAARRDGIVTRKEGEGRRGLRSGRRVEALYEYPFQAHAPVEPMNGVADVRADRAELWVPTQAASRAREKVAAALGLPVDRVDVHVPLVGGGFGRRLGIDYAVEAAQVSRAAGEPVQVLWSRQDDFHHGHFQPASAHHMAGAADAKGRLVAWAHTKAGSYLSVLDAPTAEERTSPAYWRDSSWGAYDIPYSIRSIETAYVPVDSPVPSGPWRAVYSPSCTFARECFADEMAHAAGVDPLRFRLEMLAPGRIVEAGSLKLDQGRLRNVLAVAGDAAGWGKPLPRGWGRGLACNIYDGETCIAYVAEVSVEDGRLRVQRVVCAVDCGIVINPSGVEAQIEGGIAFALSTVLGGEITFRAGRVEQSSYRDYPVVRMDQMPRVEIHIVPSTVSPTGMGEPPVPPLAPAVLNALFAATGRRVRRLPLSA